MKDIPTINIFLFPPNEKKEDEHKQMLKKMLAKKDDLMSTVKDSMSEVARLISRGTSHVGGG